MSLIKLGLYFFVITAFGIVIVGTIIIKCPAVLFFAALLFLLFESDKA